MAGICGMLALDGSPVDARVLTAMTDTLRHRGSPGGGIALSEPCGLGMVYRAYGHPERPPQLPLHVVFEPPQRPGAPPASAWIAQDGHVYNQLEIRRALEAAGHRFDSDVDAETVLRSYIQFGAGSFVKAFRGAFALAIWDETRGRLLLLRDRLGQKPLYFWQDDHWLVFASEIKALLAHPAVPCHLNELMVPYYLAYGYSPAPDTLYEGIRQLPSGCVLTADLNVGQPVIRQDAYWHSPYPSSGTDPRSERDIASDLLAHLRWAVRLRLPEGVPAGALVTGGIDSAALVALLAQESAHTIHTFSVNFAAQPRSFDDARFERLVAGHFVTEHHEVTVDPDFESLIDELVGAFDGPFGDAAAVPAYLLNREAAQVVPVVLSGDGSDEVFAGYDHFRTARLARNYSYLPDVAQRAIGSMFDRLSGSVQRSNLMEQASRIVQSAGMSLPEQFLTWSRYVPGEWLAALMGGQREQAVREHYAGLFASPHSGDAPDVIAQLLDVNLRSYVPDDLLVRVDRCSAAASLDVRLPFLDHQIIHFASNITSGLKLRRGTTKYILRQALKGILPDAILEWKHEGLALPMRAWFQGDLGDYARTRLLDDHAAVRSLFDMQALRAMFDAQAAGEAGLSHALWALLTFEVWLRHTFG